MLRYTKLRELSPEEWKGLSLAHRQELKRYVAGKFRGFYAEVSGETIYLGCLVEGRANDDDTYVVVNRSRPSMSRGSAARNVYRHVAYKIKKAQGQKTRRLKAKKP